MITISTLDAAAIVCFIETMVDKGVELYKREQIAYANIKQSLNLIGYENTKT